MGKCGRFRAPEAEKGLMDSSTRSCHESRVQVQARKAHILLDIGTDSSES